MITGIGVDIVDIRRFSDYHQKPKDQLRKLFSETELSYCLGKEKQHQARHFAARFAAKEALLKALYSSCPNINLSLMTICQLVAVESPPPRLIINWNTIEKKARKTLPKLHSHISLSHTDTTAIAFVVLQSTFKRPQCAGQSVSLPVDTENIPL